MRTDQVRLSIGVGVEERFLAKKGSNRYQMLLVLEQMPHVLEMCAQLFEKAHEMIKHDMITPTRFGLEIDSPFNGAELIADGAGDEELIAGIERIKLVHALTTDDSISISFDEACKRGSANPGTDWGQRAAFALRDAGNDGRISTKVWPRGTGVICGKTRWLDNLTQHYSGWVVVRTDKEFGCKVIWDDSPVNGHCKFVSLG